MTAPDPRPISEIEAHIAEAQYRRAGGYVEIAEEDATLGSRISNPNSFPSPRRQQDWPGDTVGASGLGAVSVCRMGDMREAVAIASGDGVGVGTGEPNLVTVRIQNAPEGFSFPHIVFQTSQTIRDVCLLSSCNPVLNVNTQATEDKTLMLVVWFGDDPDSITRLYTSNNYGNTWVQVWQSTSGRIRQPRFMQGGDGAEYLFFRDSNDDGLYYYVNGSQSPSTWQDAFAWDNASAATFLWTLADGGDDPTVFDMAHDGRTWVYGACYQSGGSFHNIVKLNPAATPVMGSWFSIDVNLFAAGVGVEWVRVGRTGGHDEFGNFPPDAVLLATKRGGEDMAYFVFDSDLALLSITRRTEIGSPIYQSVERWQNRPGGFFWGWSTPASPYQDYNKVSNKEVWNTLLTPSTNVSYVNDIGGLGWCVKVDTHGPTDDDHDSGDTFPSFWTRSNENHSVAFPEFDAARDVDIYFKFRFFNADYHNTWFVVDDPTHPDVPIFKADFYVGHDADADTHPMDTARGLGMFFCKPVFAKHPLKTDPDSGRGTALLEYHHPENLMFQGYDSIDDNLRVWDFWLHYDHSTDMFELNWNPDGAGYVPFVPYLGHPLGDREYVDIGPDGTDDIYVASPTEKYWRQPRNGMWPRRFYFGCPEQKPAIQKQSGIMVGDLSVYTDTTYTAETPQYPACIVPRLSGALDVWYAEGDVLYRHTMGHGWQDLYTLTQGHSTVALNAGPDQAEITLQNSDNLHSVLYDNLRHYHAMCYARGGSRTRRIVDPYDDGGEWGAWRCLFFGTSDTGEPQDTSQGSTITMRLFSPLRDMSRSTRTQGFTSIEPPAVKDPDTGEDTGVVDTKAMREWNVIFQTDFDRPADYTLPVDALERLMRFDDYITTYVWTDLLGNPADKLDVERVGFTPSNFTVNQGGGATDLLESLRGLWSKLGLYTWFDYDNGGIFRVWKRDTFALDAADPEIVLKARSIVAVPFSRQDTDFQRTGNAVTTTSNLESRPNMAVARVAPWPDGADSQDTGVEEVGGLASQAATSLMYNNRMPFNLLRSLWEGANQVSIPIAAFPYLRVGMLVEIALDGDLPLTLGQRYAPLARRYQVLSLDTEFGPDHLTTTATLIRIEEFPTP